MRSDVDLSALSSDAIADDGTRPDREARDPAGRRNTRLLALQTWGPLGVAATLAVALGAWFLVPYAEPVTPVTVSPIVVRVDSAAARRVSAVQASGWVEPDPYPIEIAPLVHGVVAELPVVEGTPLVAGETVVARLDTTLIDAAIAEVEAEVARARARVAEARTQLDSAGARLVQNLDARLAETRLAHDMEELQRLRAMAAARLNAAREALRLNTANRLVLAAERQRLAARTGDRDRLVQEIQAMTEELVWYRQEADALTAMAADAAGSELKAAEARARVTATESRLAGMRARVVQLGEEIVATRNAIAAAEEAVESPVDLQRAADEAAADIDGIDGVIDQHHLHHAVAAEAVNDPVLLRTARNNAAAALAVREREQAAAEAHLQELEVRRRLHTVRSPLDGEVLAVKARPGARISDGNPVVITAFEPGLLQVRVDLPFSDMPTIRPGQRAQVISDSAPDHRYDGEVIRLVRQADIARNTLEVKVRVANPDEALRPEMLVRVRFLPSMPERDPDSSAPTVERYFVPDAALVQVGEGSAIFVYDPRGRFSTEGAARLVPVEALTESGTEPAGHMEVRGELSRTWRVIDRPAGLTDGARVRLPAPARPASAGTVDTDTEGDTRP